MIVTFKSSRDLELHRVRSIFVRQAALLTQKLKLISRKRSHFVIDTLYKKNCHYIFIVIR